VHEFAVQMIANGPLVAVLLSVVFALAAWRVGVTYGPVVARQAGIVVAGAAVAVFALTPALADPAGLAVAVVLPPSLQAGYVLAVLAAPLFMAAVVMIAISLGHPATAAASSRRPRLPDDARS